MRILLIISLLLGAIEGIAQISFQKTFGSHHAEQASRIIQGHDSSYVVVGSSGLTYYSSDVYLLKVDSLGNYLWSAYYGGSNQEHGTDLVQTPDSGFAICGYTNSMGNGGYDAYLIKVDKNGVLEWEKTFGGADWDFANALIMMPDSGFTMIGETYSLGEGNGDMYLIRTDKNGNLMWENTIGTAGRDVGIDIVLTGLQNNYVAVGHTDGIGAGMDDIWVARLDLQGDTLFTNLIGDTLDDHASQIDVIVNNYNIIGTRNTGPVDGNDMFLARVDFNLDTVFTKTFGGAGHQYGRGMAVRPSVDQMIVGDLEVAGFGTHNYLAYYTNFLGVFLGSYTAGGFAEEHCNDVEYTYDDAFILCGTSDSYTVGATDIYLIKMGPAPNFTTSSTIDSQFQDFTDVEDEEARIDLSVFPNPAQDFIQIEGEALESVEVYDLHGRLMMKEMFNQSNINIQTLSLGWYNIKAYNKEGQIGNVQFLKQ